MKTTFPDFSEIQHCGSNGNEVWVFAQLKWFLRKKQRLMFTSISVPMLAPYWKFLSNVTIQRAPKKKNINNVSTMYLCIRVSKCLLLSPMLDLWWCGTIHCPSVYLNVARTNNSWSHCKHVCSTTMSHGFELSINIMIIFFNSFIFSFLFFF